ncbi:MAG TPA: xanthine dehydrogenase family protein subunit M, partial [Candidatus Binatia bacterium]
DAGMVIAGAAGERVVAAQDFFLSAYGTALQSGEMLTEIRLSPWPRGAGWAVLEVSPHHGSFAIAGAAVRLEIDPVGRGRNVRIALFGVDHAARRAERAEKRLEGETIDEGSVAAAARQTMEEVEPYDDVQASADYRRHIAGVLVNRALKQALARAGAKKA